MGRQFSVKGHHGLIDPHQLQAEEGVGTDIQTLQASVAMDAELSASWPTVPATPQPASKPTPQPTVKVIERTVFAWGGGAQGRK